MPFPVCSIVGTLPKAHPRLPGEPGLPVPSQGAPRGDRAAAWVTASLCSLFLSRQGPLTDANESGAAKYLSDSASGEFGVSGLPIMHMGEWRGGAGGGHA